LQIIYGGDDSFNAVVYGDQNPANLNYFQRQIESVSNTLTSVGQQFFADIDALREKYNGAEALRLMKAATRAAKSLFKPNKIQSIFDIGEMQHAPMVMQRWVMANPMVREVYHKQGCDGYSDTYKDMYPGMIGENHYDYRRVMDGVIREDGDEWYAKFYMDELVEGDRELSHDDKVDILSTWDIAEMFIKAGKEDPTSAYNTTL